MLSANRTADCVSLRYSNQQDMVRRIRHLQTWQYEWSSARYHVGMKEKDLVIDFDCPGKLNLSAEERKEMLQADPAEMELLRMSTQTGQPCGRKAFVDKMEWVTGRILRRRWPGPKRRCLT
jgi:hypothetical protein